MDPNPITASDWRSLATLLNNLWLFVPAAFAAALAWLLGLAIIPSLIATGQLPARLHRVRPLFYLAGAAALGLAAWFLAQALAMMPTVYAIYPRSGI